MSKQKIWLGCHPLGGKRAAVVLELCWKSCCWVIFAPLWIVLCFWHNNPESVSLSPDVCSDSFVIAAACLVVAVSSAVFRMTVMLKAGERGWAWGRKGRTQGLVVQLGEWLACCKPPAPECGSCVQDVSVLSSFGFCTSDVHMLRPSTRTASVFLQQLLALAGWFSLGKLNYQWEYSLLQAIRVGYFHRSFY